MGQCGGWAGADGRTTAGRGARWRKGALVSFDFSERAAGEAGRNNTKTGRGGGRAEADVRTTAGRGASGGKGFLVTFEFSGRAAGEGGRNQKKTQGG